MLYDTIMNQEREMKEVDVKFKGIVMDVDFNPKYHMIVISGYGK
jgi:hypothetical protein